MTISLIDQLVKRTEPTALAKKPTPARPALPLAPCPLPPAPVILIEATGQLLAAFHPRSQAKALKDLHKRGVEVMLDALVVQATSQTVHLKNGQLIPTQTLIWAAGVRANPLANALVGLEQTRARNHDRALN